MLLLTRETDPYSSMLTEPELPQECNRYVPLSHTHTLSHIHAQMTKTERDRDREGKVLGG